MLDFNKNKRIEVMFASNVTLQDRWWIWHIPVGFTCEIEQRDDGGFAIVSPFYCRIHSSTVYGCTKQTTGKTTGDHKRKIMDKITIKIKDITGCEYLVVPATGQEAYKKVDGALIDRR